MTTFSVGKLSSTFLASDLMLPGSETSPGSTAKPLCAAASSLWGERAAITTRLPRFANSPASASPIPEPPPVIRTVFPVACMRASCRGFIAPTSDFAGRSGGRGDRPPSLHYDLPLHCRMKGTAVRIHAAALGEVAPGAIRGDAAGVEALVRGRGMGKEILVDPHDGVAALNRQHAWVELHILDDDGMRPGGAGCRECHQAQSQQSCARHMHTGSQHWLRPSCRVPPAVSSRARDAPRRPGAP